MQKLIVTLVILAAIGYATWWVYNTIHHADDPCYGCEGCPLKEAKQKAKHKKPDCWHKK